MEVDASLRSALRSLLDSLSSPSRSHISHTHCWINMKKCCLFIILGLEVMFISPTNASLSKHHLCNFTQFNTFTLFSLRFVFFRYNNKTYRIDDIAWDHTPNNTFKRGDTNISFKMYYKTVSVIQNISYQPSGLNRYMNTRCN